MSKVRIYELARELNVESKILITRAKNFGIDAATHQSTLSAEQVETLKNAFKNSRGPASAKVSVNTEEAKSPAASSSAPKVIRRRKAVEAEPVADTSSAPNETTVAPATLSDSSGSGTESAAEESSQAPGTEVTEVSMHVAEQVSVPDALEVDAKGIQHPPSDQPKPEIQLTTVNKAQEGHTQPQSTRTPQVQDKFKIVRDPLPNKIMRPIPTQGAGASSATIVRKATPQEVEESRLSRERESQRGRREIHKKEDSRGTRVTGLGFGGDPSALQNVPKFPEEESGDRIDRKKDKERKSKFETEEEALVKRPPKLRRVQSAVTMRALLNQADGTDEVEAEEGSPEKVEVKTVYTPKASHRKRDLKRRKDLKKTAITTPRAAYRIVKMEEAITVGELAQQMSVKAAELIKKLMDGGMLATINTVIDADTAVLLATDYGFEVENKAFSMEELLQKEHDADQNLSSRPPIVTIMGHVDHGKTSILDVIRMSDVAAGELGGITQHIGAYTVVHNNRTIAFLDTPGHEAFSSMRARGAKLTDIVILVVAADDGVMPQTKEAIAHSKDAKVPIIVAINKIDKPNVNFDRIYRELAELGVQSEDWGGENQFVKVSALQKLGIDELLDAILLQADILELKANPDSPARGIVVEAHLDKGRGPVVTVMVQNGTLRMGDQLVIGGVVGRVRAMLDHHGKNVAAAGPSTPVEVTGMSAVPAAGDHVTAVTDEAQAEELAQWYNNQQRKKAALLKTGGLTGAAVSLESLLGKIKEQDIAEVPVIIKADTKGSVEAIEDVLRKLNTEKVVNRVVHKNVGGVNESDVTLAKASGAIIVAFNVRAARGLDEKAEHDGVVIKYFGIIYEIVDAVKALMAGKLPPVVKETIIGHAEVRSPISVPKVGVIAGSAVIDGKITRNSMLRLIRDQIVVYSGQISSLRRFKDDVKEVASGYECGIGIAGYNDLRPGDVIEAYTIEHTFTAEKM